MSATDRSRVVHGLRTGLERRAWLRLQLLAVIAVAGVVGFGVSYLLLRTGVDSMAWRYGAASIVGYATFALFLRMWVGWRASVDLDPLADPLLPDMSWRSAGPELPDFFAGGRSRGGGASAGWISSAAEQPASKSSGGGLDVDLGDSFVWVLVLLAASCAGAAAVGYVIYTAPALVAELMVDAAIVSTVYRRVSVVETRHWAATVIRRTWLPAAVLTLSLMAGGYALQKVAPGTRSIGPAIAAIMASR